MKKTTLKDLSKIAGLSANTISRALNGKAGVSEKTREYIRSLAEAYNYHPNMMARTMRGGQNRMIGVLVGDIQDAFFVELLSGIEEVATQNSMVIMVGNTNNDLSSEKNSLDMLLSYKCENFIITPAGNDLQAVNILKQAGVNFVIADRTFACVGDCNQVSIDNRADSRKAVEYLIAQGHRKIAIINQDSEISTETDRTKGYQDALLKNGIPVSDTLQKFVKPGSGAGSVCRALFENPQDAPTAVFIAKDTLSMQVTATLLDMGLVIPEDVSVMIYGCPAWSQAFRPYITCMDRPVKDIGRQSAQIILRSDGKKKAEPVTKYLDSKLLIRDSVKKLDT